MPKGNVISDEDEFEKIKEQSPECGFN